MERILLWAFSQKFRSEMKSRISEDFATLTVRTLPRPMPKFRGKKEEKKENRSYMRILLTLLLHIHVQRNQHSKFCFTIKIPLTFQVNIFYESSICQMPSSDLIVRKQILFDINQL